MVFLVVDTRDVDDLVDRARLLVLGACGKVRGHERGLGLGVFACLHGYHLRLAPVSLLTSANTPWSW